MRCERGRPLPKHCFSTQDSQRPRPLAALGSTPTRPKSRLSPEVGSVEASLELRRGSVSFETKASWDTAVRSHGGRSLVRQHAEAKASHAWVPSWEEDRNPRPWGTKIPAETVVSPETKAPAETSSSPRTEVLVETDVSVPTKPEKQLLCFAPTPVRSVFLEGFTN